MLELGRIAVLLDDGLLALHHLVDLCPAWV